MLVVLGDRDADLRDLMLLVAVHHPQVGGIGQILPAFAVPLREPIPLVIGPLHPGEVRARGSPLLTLRDRFGPPRRFLAAGGRPARIVVPRRRHRGVAGVARQQVLHPGQLRGQLLVQRGQRGDLLGLLTDDHEQLLARHLLRLKHPKITLRPGRHLRDRHAKIEGSDSTSRRRSRLARSNPGESPRRPEQLR